MSFTNNTRDEVTLIFLKHKYRANEAIWFDKSVSYDVRHAALAENQAIRATFKEVRERNMQNIQAGTYEAIGKLCADFLQSVEAEPAEEQVR